MKNRYSLLNAIRQRQYTYVGRPHRKIDTMIISDDNCTNSLQ